MTKNRHIWVGVSGNVRVPFRTDYRIDAYGPPVVVKGQTMAAVIGPFRTMRAARLMADPDSRVPFLRTVADAEYAARKLTQGARRA